MSGERLQMEWIPGRFAVCRLAADAPLPDWAGGDRPADRLLSLTRTDRELSIVADERRVPADAEAEGGWLALRVAGTLDFSTTGVLARLAGALAAAGIPVLAISTYDTDVLLVRGDDAHRAVEALGAEADVSRL